MKPAPFDYVDPRSLPEALDLLARHGDDAKILAGGQSLVPMLNLRLARPGVVIDINRVAGLDAVAVGDGLLHVGSLVRQRGLERWASARVPLLATVLLHIGHAAIRARGTVAGSVVHADPAAELPALLLCLDGSVTAESHRGRREIPATALFEGPLTTAVQPDEIVTETRWTLPAPAEGWGFHEIARRHGDFALAGVTALLRVEDGRVSRARLALFGVGFTPVRAEAAEQTLVGAAPTASQLAEAARLAAEGLDPGDDLHAPATYRRRVARTLAERALSDAAARARSTG
jgi:CO/xanthine dehydrogenase FAD-binding subunit